MLSFVADFETLLQLSLHLCQFTCTPWNLGKKITFYHFSKKCPFSVFLHIEAQLSLKNACLPPVFFLDFSSPWYDLLVSHSHYLGKNASHYWAPSLNSRKPQAHPNRHNLLPFQKQFDRLIFYSKAQSSTAPNHIRIVLSFPTAWSLYSYWEEGTYYWFKYWQFPILYYNIFFIVIFSLSPFLLDSDARYLSGISWKRKRKEKRDFVGQSRK